jgi:hypothetical protein
MSANIIIAHTVCQRVPWRHTEDDRCELCAADAEIAHFMTEGWSTLRWDQDIVEDEMADEFWLERTIVFVRQEQSLSTPAPQPPPRKTGNGWLN